MKKQQNTQANDGERKLVTVEVLDGAGHTTLMLSPTETEQYVSNQESSWIFVDGLMVQSDQIPQVNWRAAQKVHVSPALVGGKTPPASAT